MSTSTGTEPSSPQRMLLSKNPPTRFWETIVADQAGHPVRHSASRQRKSGLAGESTEVEDFVRSESAEAWQAFSDGARIADLIAAVVLRITTAAELSISCGSRGAGGRASSRDTPADAGQAVGVGGSAAGGGTRLQCRTRRSLFLLRVAGCRKALALAFNPSPARENHMLTWWA